MTRTHVHGLHAPPDHVESCMLAHTWGDPLAPFDWNDHDHFRGWWMSEKLDGWRVILAPRRSGLVTREGVRLRPPRWWMMHMPDLPAALDGELWIDRRHTHLDVASRVNGGDWRDLRLMGFDLVLGDGATFEERVRWLAELLMVRMIPSSTSLDFFGDIFARSPEHVFGVAHTRCEGLDHLREFYDSVVASGGEGVMLRKPGSMYEHGRSWNLIKLKGRP